MRLSKDVRDTCVSRIKNKLLGSLLRIAKLCILVERFSCVGSGKCGLLLATRAEGFSMVVLSRVTALEGQQDFVKQNPLGVLWGCFVSLAEGRGVVCSVGMRWDEWRMQTPVSPVPEWV